MRKLILLLFTMVAVQAYSQQAYDVEGMVADTSKQPLAGATVKIVFGKDSLFTTTSAKGIFQFTGISKDSFQLSTTYSGLDPFVQFYQKQSSSPVFRVPQIVMLPAGIEMEGIIIRSSRPVIIKEDTIQYDVSAYKVREGAAVEDVIKKLPGVTVDKDGNIETQGKKVARVRVNGKDFFGGDVQTATQNLPADAIENIQVIDDYGDQANLTGNKDGEPEKIININTKKNRNNGSFGNATVAAGNEGRYAGNVFVNHFKDEKQVSFLAGINNTNANLFNFNGGGRGGGNRGGNMGGNDRGMGGAGISITRSAGINFRNKWGKKWSGNGSYSYSSRNSKLQSASFSRDYNPLNIRTTLREGTNQNSGSNHRLTWNLEYALDTNNFFKISPYFSYGNSENEGQSWSEISRPKYYTLNTNEVNGDSHSPNAGSSFLYNHKFRKRGRNFSVNLSMDVSTNSGDRYSNSSYHNVDSNYSPILVKDTNQVQRNETLTRNSRANARFSYTEPLNSKRTLYLVLDYDWNRSATKSMRDVYDLDDPSGQHASYNYVQSNHYDYRFITNRAGVSIKGSNKKFNYSAGFQSQPSSLSGRTIGKSIGTSYHNINWIPSARFVYNFARSHALTVTLGGTAREPGFMQLQPVADSSNLNNIVVGNPELRNEFVNRFSLRYNKFDAKSGSSLFINLSYDKTSDKIVNSRINHPTGTGRTTTYLNTDGFYGYNGNISFTKPFSNRKYSAGVSMAANFDNNISYTDGFRNRGRNWNLKPGASFRLDLDNIIDLNFVTDYVIYQTTTRYDKGTTVNKARTLNLGLNGKNYFGDFTIGYDATRVINYGFSSSVNSNITMLNLMAEYRFLKGKRMTVRMQGFDLLNKNTSITRVVTETTVTDTRNNRLARYFLLSVNFRINKLSGGNNKAVGNRPGT